VLPYSSETEAAESGSEVSDEVCLSDHEDEESTTNEQHPSQPDVVLERTDDQKHGKLEKINGE